MKLKTFLAIAVITFTVTLSGLIATQPAQATNWENNPCEYLDCEPSIVVLPTEDVTPEPTLEITPEITEEPTASPTAEVTQTPSTNGGDGKGTGVSDGRHTAPDGLGCAVHECKAIPNGPPATGKGR